MPANGWVKTPLCELLNQVCRDELVRPTQEYRLLGARWYAKGLYIKDIKAGSSIRADRIYRVEQGDFVYNRLFAWKGSFAIASRDVDGCYVSNEFPCFKVDVSRLSGKFLWYYLSNETVWGEALELSSGGTPISRNRLKKDQFLSMHINLPNRKEQDRIVAKLDNVVFKIEEAREGKNKIRQEAEALLHSAYARVFDGAPSHKMGEVAPLVRREVKVCMGEEYPELGIRSFGKGTFHKPALDYLSVGTKRLYRIEPGDLLFSNVFAWEGAIAVAQPTDVGRFGSHRFITCVPKQGNVTAEFLHFYFLTDEGLRKIGEASPGGAGRNRTLGLAKLAEIEVPVPAYEKQVWFTRLQTKVRELLTAQEEAEIELNAILPSILDKAFKGEL